MHLTLGETPTPAAAKTENGGYSYFTFFSKYCIYICRKKVYQASIMNREGVCHEDLRTSCSQ